MSECKTCLGTKSAGLAKKYLPLAVEFLKEAIRCPHDHVDKDDPECGLSNHELPRIEYLRQMLIKHKCVENPNDTAFDEYGNLVWTVSDPKDGIEPHLKKVVYFDGHTDTVNALRSHWHSRVGEGLDPYLGLIDASKVNEEGLRREMGYVPPRDEWNHLVWGRGGADQLAGVISQMIATKILLELREFGSLSGVIVRSYGTVCEEDNDGGGPMFLVKEVFPGAKPEVFPDAVIFTEGTGDSRLPLGSLGIYRGQRGRMQIEVEVTGKSCHGSMPWEGLNPLEAASPIIAEAAEKYDKREGFKDNDFLSHGTRTASWCHLNTPSDCAVPEKFTFRFDRRLTAGETPEQSLKDIDSLASVERARNKGFRVEVRTPVYEGKTWKQYQLKNPQIYNAWVTPEDHVVIQAAVATYKSAISRFVNEGKDSRIPKEPRVSRWIFSTDGVGFIVPAGNERINPPPSKKWIQEGAVKYPAMFGIGAGFEQNTHKIGECVDARELQHACAFLARFPAMLKKFSQ